MLVLTCRDGEGIMIGPDIRVSVDMSDGHEKRAKLQIVSPRDTVVARMDKEGRPVREADRARMALTLQRLMAK